MLDSRKFLFCLAIGQIACAPACGQNTSQEATSTVTVTESNAGPASSAASSATAAPADPFEATLLPVKEMRGPASIDIQLPQLTGGDAAVRDRFNSGMRTALDDFAKPADSPTTIVDGSLPEDTRSGVTAITPNVVAGVAVFNWYAEHGAHPYNGVATITIDAKTAKPVLLTDVFPDQQAAAQRLATKVTELNPQVVPFDQTMEQFLNWVPTPNGFRVYVPVIHAMGDYWPVTVPWGEISDLMTPAARTTLIQ